MHRGCSRLLALTFGILFATILAEVLCRLLKTPVAWRSGAEVIGRTVLLPLNPEPLQEFPTERLYRSGGYTKPSPVLGWTLHRSVTFGLYRTNRFAFRSEREDRRKPLPGVLRIATFGDSFTHCDEVEYRDCWSAILERSLPGSEVLNFGVQGYGTDQAYLRYREYGRTFDPDVVVLGLALTDLQRNLNIFRFLAAETTTLTKPRFVLEGDELRLVNQPVLSPKDVVPAFTERHPLLRFDAWFDPREWEPSWLDWSDLYRFLRGYFRPSRIWAVLRDASPDGEPTRVAAEIVRTFRDEVEAHGRRFVCVIIPDRDMMKTDDVARWDPLLEEIRADGVILADPTPMLMARRDDRDLYAPEGHFDRMGNEIIAAAVRAAILDPASNPVLEPCASASASR